MLAPSNITTCSEEGCHAVIRYSCSRCQPPSCPPPPCQWQWPPRPPLHDPASSPPASSGSLQLAMAGLGSLLLLAQLCVLVSPALLDHGQITSAARTRYLESGKYFFASTEIFFFSRWLLRTSPEFCIQQVCVVAKFVSTICPAAM